MQNVGNAGGGPAVVASVQQRVGMNHAAFGACELGRQLRQKKLQELKMKRELNKSKVNLKTNSFNRMRESYSKQRPLFIELLRSEKVYVEKLHVVVSRFMLPLQVALENYPYPVLLTRQEMSNVFGNIAQIFEVNMELLRIIESNLGLDGSASHAEKKDDDDLATAFAEAFTNMLPVFKAFYSVYANNYEKGIDVMEECRAQNPFFDRFLDVAKSHEACKNLGLADYLIEPVQRICRYPLFFKELLKLTDENHLMYAKLKAASEAVGRIANQVDQTGQEAERAMKIFEVANQLEGLEKHDCDFQVVTAGRRFEYQFQCKVHYSFQAPGAKPTKEMRHAPYKKKPRECFLFTDAILIAKPSGEKLEFRFWLELENILVTIPPSHTHAAEKDPKKEAKKDLKEGDGETFSAAQKRLPLDIVRIRIISNEKKPKKDPKGGKSDQPQRPNLQNSPTGDSFSSSSSQSLEQDAQQALTNSPKAPSKSPAHNRHSSSSSGPIATNSAPAPGVPVVEKYTLWFKSGAERQKVFQRINTLQQDLENLKEQRESHLNQKSTAPEPVSLQTHGEQQNEESPKSATRTA